MASVVQFPKPRLQIHCSACGIVSDAACDCEASLSMHCLRRPYRRRLLLAKNKEWGIIVCEFCLKAGNIDASIQQNIDGLTRNAAYLRTLVGHLGVPMFEEWQAAGT